jgi:hypothetical protein
LKKLKAKGKEKQAQTEDVWQFVLFNFPF